MLTSKEYLNMVSETPNESYRNIIQATLNSEWEDNTQIYTIKEQSALPFVNEYTETEVYLDTISDDMINTSKVYSDFVRIIFKDINHKQNYKGQYYKLAIDDDKEEYYICYDRINSLSVLADTKVVRCNNVLTYRDEYGNIKTLPCYLGTDISSTNNQVSKEATIPNVRMIILVQANEFTKNIRNNQRLMFQHSSCFKVEEVNNFMWEQGTDGDITCVKIYVSYSTVIPNDNLELNLCDYYNNNNYTISINQDNLKQKKGFVGKLTATIKDENDNIVDYPILWESDNDSVIIDKYGNYEIVGNVGDKATITVKLKDNLDISDSISIDVVNDYLPEKIIVVNPSTKSYIKQGKYQDFECKVYIEGDEQLATIDCVGSGADKSKYTISKITDGYRVKCNGISNVPLKLTFTSQGCDDVNVEIELKGVV